MGTQNNQGRSNNPVNHATQAKQFQNKDKLDSREHEENEFKGEDITHNKKEKKSENKQKDDE
ncbi:hypothetical protein GQF61_02370 [Sphingobacterium sp. DK4209]|uniref:Uncharacterized protein n=1 Tax=Sphingobacterium zhuxiongii TaxID=2662364 RepID=A0A5Q0QDM0_9SPHI|nr:MULTISPECIES: hypothetical protein [unclassified Sphingobacterium]MVZ64683.1 hypothetical protein [Sphingobacterium sp. DK4209]QGA27021.1 hypothetical protein GFH32_12125 [Sphingobacterium sp. dk4302]